MSYLMIIQDQHVEFDTVQSGWSIVYIEGVTGYNFQKIFLSLKIVFVLTNSADPDKMSHYSLFAKVPVLGFWSSKG